MILFFYRVHAGDISDFNFYSCKTNKGGKYSNLINMYINYFLDRIRGN